MNLSKPVGVWGLAWEISSSPTAVPGAFGMASFRMNLAAGLPLFCSLLAIRATTTQPPPPMQPPPPVRSVRLVTATRAPTRDAFDNTTALARSLRRLGVPWADAVCPAGKARKATCPPPRERFDVRVALNNSRGLSEVYNEHLLAVGAPAARDATAAAADDPDDPDAKSDMVLFVHDDVWIDDFFTSSSPTVTSLWLRRLIRM